MCDNIGCYHQNSEREREWEKQQRYCICWLVEHGFLHVIECGLVFQQQHTATAAVAAASQQPGSPFYVLLLKSNARARLVYSRAHVQSRYNVDKMPERAAAAAAVAVNILF